MIITILAKDMVLLDRSQFQGSRQQLVLCCLQPTVFRDLPNYRGPTLCLPTVRQSWLPLISFLITNFFIKIYEIVMLNKLNEYNKF